MKAQQWCGAVLLALAVVIIYAPLANEGRADTRQRPQPETTRERGQEIGERNKKTLSAIEQLGKELFFDEELSMPHGQACASCHDPATGFTSPSSEINAGPAIITGAVEDRAGSRKPPSVAYAGESPVFHFEGVDGGQGRWIGGLFCDGRATGQTLGDPLAEQALQPFVNDVE